MSESSAAIGLASASSGCAAAEQLGLRLGDERPGHGLGHAARGQRALGLAGAHLRGGQHGLARRVAAIERRRGDAIDADDAHDLLDDVGLAFDVRPPRRRRDLHALVLAGDEEAELGQHAPHLDETEIEAGEALQFAGREVDDLFRRFRLAGDGDLRRRAAAELHHHLRRELQPRHHEVRIDAALEAIARVGVDAELAPGLRDVERLPQRRFDQHVGGGLVAARGLAAHDAGERLDAAVVGDHAHGVVERVGLAVERQQLLAVLRAAHDEIALHLLGVEHVQRPAAVVGDEVGDVDQRVDRAKPDRLQPLLQPLRRRAVLDAAHEAQREGRAERMGLAEVELDRDRAGEFALDRLRRALLERADVGRGQIAGDAVDAGAVGPVRREVDVDHRIVEAGALAQSSRRPARRPAAR